MMPTEAGQKFDFFVQKSWSFCNSKHFRPNIMTLCCSCYFYISIFNFFQIIMVSLFLARHDQYFMMFKACVRYFLENIYFFTKWYLFKTEKCFLFHPKSFFCSRDIQIFVIFFLPFHTFQIQKNKWKWNNLWCHELACINLQM